MTIANNVASKLFVAFVAAAMLFSLATPAKAATVEELQAQIAALMAQITSLSGGASASASACTFTRALTVGSQGSDVTCLQTYLTSTGHFSNAGGATGYFGPVTQAAVAAWQSANGVSPAAGYFGPVSQAKYNALMAMSGGDNGGDDSSDDDDDSSTGGLSGEASLDSVTINDSDDNNIEEGAEDAEIAEIDVEFSDGDAMITRLDIALELSGGEPWEAFDEVSLWVDGDEVARESASDEDDYLDEDDGSIRFSGLDIRANEDEEVTIVVAATVQTNLDAADLGDWEAFALSMRFVDGDDVTSTEDATGDLIGDTTAPFTGDPSASFTIEEEGGEDELIVKTSTSDPSGTTLQLEDDTDSDWFTVFAFDLDTDDSTNDIELNEIPVTLSFSSSTYNTLVDDVELVIDGTTIDDVTVTNGASAAATLTFDVDGDVVIDAGDRVTAELMVRFNSLALGNEGVSASGTVTSAQADLIVAEGADDLGDSQTSGSASGDDHTLRTTGVNVSAGDMSATVSEQDGATNDYATYEIEIVVEAFEQDVYLSVDPATSTNYSLETSAGAAVVAGSRTAVLESTGDEESGYFVIREGDEETITLTVTYVPGAANTAARLQLDSIEFAETGVAPTQIWTASPAEDYRTGVVNVVN